MAKAITQGMKGVRLGEINLTCSRPFDSSWERSQSVTEAWLMKVLKTPVYSHRVNNCKCNEKTSKQKDSRLTAFNCLWLYSHREGYDLLYIGNFKQGASALNFKKT